MLAGAPTFTDLLVTGGVADTGGAFAVDAAGELRLIGVTLTGNHAGFSGGAIANFGDLSLVESAVSGNSAGTSPTISGEGGGIYIGPDSGAVQLLNSTISDNAAALDVEGFSQGGGIYAAQDFTSDFVTIANNSAAVGGGMSTTPGGGSASVHYTLVAGNVGGSCAGVVDEYVESFNLEDRSGCEFDDSSDIQVGDAFLAPLAYNGGQTQTHGLLPESRAIGARISSRAHRSSISAATRDPTGRARSVPSRSSSSARPSPATNRRPRQLHRQLAQCTLREAVDQASAYDTVFVPAGVWASMAR